MNPYIIFKKEFDELESFYKTSSFSIQKIFEIYKHEKKTKAKDNDNSILLLTMPSFYKKNGQFVLNQQYFLRELILVRLISALEVYLIDNIKYIAANNIFIFKTEEIISFTVSEIISFNNIAEIYEKLITRDCRKLSSGGYKKIIAYYNSKFKQNLSSIYPGLKVMEEYHDRRHLFVHRLGKTDEYYRKKYNLVRAGLSIDEKYLLKAFDDIKLYTQEIDKNTKTLIDNKPNPKSSKNEKLIVFKFKYKVELPDFLNAEFLFWHNDKLVSAKDIIKSFTVLDDNVVEVVLFGETPKVSAFYKNAKNHIAANKDFSSFQIIQQVNYDLQKKKPETFRTPKIIFIDEDTIDKVKSLLPEQPWRIDVHREVAEKLELDNKIVKRSIRELIKRGIFKNQRDGQIIE